MSLQVFTDALKRYVNLVLRPEAEWNLVAAENPSVAEVIFPFSVMGLLFSFLCALTGIALRIGERSFLLEVLAHLLIDAAGVAAFAGVAQLMGKRVDSVRPQLGGVAALYSAAGLWMSSLLAFVPIPVLGWLRLLMGAVYTGYLFYRSLDLVLGVPAHSRILALGTPLASLVLGSALVRVIFTLVFRHMGVW